MYLHVERLDGELFLKLMEQIHYMLEVILYELLFRALVEYKILDFILPLKMHPLERKC